MFVHSTRPRNVTILVLETFLVYLTNTININVGSDVRQNVTYKRVYFY